MAAIWFCEHPLAMQPKPNFYGLIAVGFVCAGAFGAWREQKTAAAKELSEQRARHDTEILKEKTERTHAADIAALKLELKQTACDSLVRDIANLQATLVQREEAADRKEKATPPPTQREKLRPVEIRDRFREFVSEAETLLERLRSEEPDDAGKLVASVIEWRKQLSDFAHDNLSLSIIDKLYSPYYLNGVDRTMDELFAFIMDIPGKAHADSKWLDAIHTLGLTAKRLQGMEKLLPQEEL